MADTIVITDPSDRPGLIDLLVGIRNAILYAFVVQKAVAGMDIPAKIDGEGFGFEDATPGEFERADLSHLAEQLRNPTARRVVEGNLALILRQSLVRLAHEVVVMYCEKTHQFPKYRAAPFFQYVRIVRNLVSHQDGAVLRKWPGDLRKAGVTSVAWRGRKIDASQVGLEVVISPAESLQLYTDIMDFVVEGLA